ncbi:MAG TPA: PAS domain-containing protein [Vicinamibacterales bacterium]
MTANEYAALIDRLDDGVVVLDAGLRVRATNPRARDVLARLGLPGERQHGAALPDLLADGPIAAALRDVAAGADERSVEDVAGGGPRRWRVFRLDRWVVALVREDARRAGLMEDALALAVKATRDGLWSWDLQTGTICVSPRFAEMLGYEPREFKTGYAEYMALIHPDDRPRIEAAFRDQLRAGAGVFHGEYRVRHRDGGWRWHLSRGASVRDGQGRVVHLAGLTSDVTHARETHEALRASEARLSAVASGAPFGIMLTGVDGTPLWANERLLALFRIDREMFRAGRLRERIHEEDRARVRDAWTRALRDGAEFDLSYRVVLPDGRERMMRGRSAPVRGVDGDVAGYVAMVEDVTEWHETERARRDLEQQLQHAQKLESLGVLAGGIAHDFNNLLVGILGNANLALLDLPPDSPVRALVRQIQAAAERSADLTRQLLAYAGRGQHVVTSVNLSSLVQELSTLLQAALSKHARLEQQLDPGVPDVLADPAQITQVVMNLLTNASEAVGEDPGVVSVRTRLVHLSRPALDALYLGSDLPEGSYVCLEVADTGHGMSSETVARIFDPFFTTKFTGRGLGLAAVLGIVRTHRGALDVETREGVGTSFRVYLPAVRMTRAASPPPESSGRGQVGGLVLVVDDEPAVRLVARRFLERWGFEVVEAENGMKAVELAGQLGDRLRLALVDLTMPYQDGRATLHALRELKAELPVVLMSGYTEQAAGGEVDRGRHVRFVQKPFTAIQLRRVVEEALAE